MNIVRMCMFPDVSARESHPRAVLLDGAAWEASTASIMGFASGYSNDLVRAVATKGKNKFQQKTLGS